MNARLIKETRGLLPMFAGTLPLIVLPSLIWPGEGLGFLALGVACVVMAGCSFGTEFQHRTLSLLLSQPIARSVIWREKMLVLGAGMLASAVALLVCLMAHALVSEGIEWLTLALIPLCAFCGTPFWTLELRRGIAGMAMAVGAPGAIMAVCALVANWLGKDTPEVLGAAFFTLLPIYCVVVYWLGYAAFKRLEVVDGRSRDLSLPAGLEAYLTRPLTRIASRYRGTFATLLKKEFRLQQVSFLLAGVFLLIAGAGFCFNVRYHELAGGIVGGDIVVYILILPLIAGAICIGEERDWGMAEWHLTLPPSALKQWSAKMLAALSTSVVLGLVLPIAVFLAAAPLWSQPGASTSSPPVAVIPFWVLGQVLVTSVAVYAASFSKNTLHAILASFVILAAGVAVILAANKLASDIAPMPIHWIGRPKLDEWLLWPLSLAALVLTVCLFQWFAWSGFRRYVQPARRLITQFALISVSLWLIAWFLFSAMYFFARG